MITLNGTNGIFRIDTDTINYWYHINNSIYIIGNSGDLITVNFPNKTDVLGGRNAINNLLYKKTASIYSSNGIVYNIQCNKLKTHSVSTNTIICTFENTSLTITCLSSSDSVTQNIYLGHVFYSAHLSKNISAKTKITVSTTIQAAIDSAVSGNVVIVPKGTYYESVLLKDGVDMIFEKGAKLYWGFSNEGIEGLRFPNNAVINIFGHGEFVCKRIGTHPTAFCSLGGGITSDIYFEFYSMVSYGQIFGVGTEPGANIFIKGYSFRAFETNTGGAPTVIDSDGFGYLDFDVVNTIMVDEYYYGYGLNNGLFVIRNSNITTEGTASGIFNNIACFNF